MSEDAAPILLRRYVLAGRLGEDECYVQVLASPEACSFPEVRLAFEERAHQEMARQYPGAIPGDGKWSDYEIPREDGM